MNTHNVIPAHLSHPVHFKNWTDNDIARLQETDSSLSALVAVAIRVAKRHSEPLHLVSGPITTGGVGSLDGNMLVFRRSIEVLHDEENLNIFSQIPFEVGMVKFHKQWRKSNPHPAYCWPILHEFYEPLFEHVAFMQFHFIHGYHSSQGARWEHQQAVTRGFGIRYLSDEFSRRRLAEMPAELSSRGQL